MDEDGLLAGLDDLLLSSAEDEEARRRAVRFAEQLPWLTVAQRTDAERTFADDWVAAARTIDARVSARSAEIATDYATRYRLLRRRCLTAVIVVTGVVIGALGLALLVAR
ncbi:hypothetical protein [Streptomyces sp. NPDC005262]|uniref:hypothetical protein n=1 Tax=Streptomyces sp. NPDC005262 TaxID=3364710 RepID=UPI003685D61C